jgi:hypothetical protein
MSDKEGWPETPDEVREFMDRLVPDESVTPEEEAAMAAALPPSEATEIMVVRSLRLPMDVDEAVAAAARGAGVTKTAWIRQAIEMALTMQADSDEPISRADALRALTLLRPVRRVA